MEYGNYTWRVYADTVNEIDTASRWIYLFESDSKEEARKYMEEVAPLEGFVNVPMRLDKVYIKSERVDEWG